MSSDNGKVAFSLGGKKKKKGASEQAKATAAAFAQDSKSSGFAASSQEDDNRPKEALVIRMSQPSNSLLARIKQEGDGGAVKEEETSTPVPSSSAPVKTEPDGPVISSGGNTNGLRASTAALPGDSSKDQLQRDLEALPDEADEETYEQVPVSQFGAALLRGMGWSEKDDTSNDKNKDQGMPRPHRLGLGAIPKAPAADENMPSVLTGRRKKAPKQTVQQLQQQEEYERKRKLELQQDKQRTKQIGSIVYLTSDSHRRVKLVQLLGVPGLNMVLVQFEGQAEPTAIKKGEIGPLVGRPELEKRPFVVPKFSKKDDRDGREKDSRRRDKDRRRDRSESPRRKRDEDRDRRRDRSRSRERDRHRSRRDRSRSQSPDDRRRDRKRDRSRSPDDRRRDRKRDRSRSPDDRRRDRKRDRSRSEDRYSDERRSNRKRDRSDRDRDRKRDRKSKDRDRDRDRDRKRRRSDDRYSDDDSDGGRRKDRRREDKSSRKSSKQGDSNPLWIIPNIRVRVVSEKLGKKYFKEKGVVVDVTRHNGATLRMDMTEGNGNSVVLEHVPERYLETALPKVGGNAIVLMGSNKWTKGRLLERNSKTSKGSIQVCEDMSILALPLDDLAEWCGPLDDDLG